MRKLLLASAAAAAALATVPAAAQTAGAPFTGLRVEGLAGYDSISDGGDQDSSSSNGLLYGGAIGYDLQVGGVVLGIEGEALGSTADTRTNDILEIGDDFRLDAGRDLYVGGRVGYAISPVALGYLKAGYTNAKFDARYRLGATRVEDSVELDGFRIGAGLEYSLGGATFIKGEYRYSNYSGINGDDFDNDLDVDRHQLVAGFGLRF